MAYPRKAYTISAVSLLMLSFMACSAASDHDKSESQSRSGGSRLKGGGHIMPKTSNKKFFSAPQGAQLTYRGGPVIPNVKVYVVLWGNQVDLDQNQISAFYTDITQSAYFDWLTEYNTQNQQIGHGSFAGVVTDSNAPAAASVDDSQIQSELANLIAGGQLPAADENNMFFVYFPPGVTITMGQDSSCQTFCAYHNSFDSNGVQAIYAVVPDLGGPCDGGCGSSGKFENTTSVSSHELIEAVTDAQVGTNNLAWYDDQYGEIGDICNGQQDIVDGFTIQQEFSNVENDCIATGNGNNGSSGVGGAGVGASVGVGVGGGGPGGNCDPCSMGPPNDPNCDQCVGFVCSFDDYCCNQAWDDICVEEAADACGVCW